MLSSADRCHSLPGDARLRTFPFQTRRPTQSELNRCLLDLTRVKVSHLTEDILRAQDEAYLASLPKPKPVPIASTAPAITSAPKLSAAEQKKVSKHLYVFYATMLMCGVRLWIARRSVYCARLRARLRCDETCVLNRPTLCFSHSRTLAGSKACAIAALSP